MIKNDRELLELAAKAAGIEIEWVSPFVAMGDFVRFPHNKETGDRYDPLIDDGDALRLAVKLGIGFDVLLTLGATEASYGEGDDTLLEYHNGDPYAATRRAIVRAAAEIERDMK